MSTMKTAWPRLEHRDDGETFAILHLASQMLGKLRVAHAPWANHGWHATLHPVAAGFAIDPISTKAGAYSLTLDLVQHAIVLQVADGARDQIPLACGSIAALHASLVAMLASHGLPARYWFGEGGVGTKGREERGGGVASARERAAKGRSVRAAGRGRASGWRRWERAGERGGNAGAGAARGSAPRAGTGPATNTPV